MKKLVLLCLLMSFVALCTSCSKERECRCAVDGESTIRIIRINSGTCEDLYSVLYDQDPVLYPDQMDSILCTDFDFANYEN